MDASATVDFYVVIVIVIVIVIVNSKLLKRHSKAKRRAPAYSRALRQIREVFQRIVRGRLRSVFQRVRECVKSDNNNNKIIILRRRRAVEAHLKKTIEVHI